MRVTLVGTGCGDPGTMTEEVKNVLGSADIIIGAPRLLEAVEQYTKPESIKAAEIKPANILNRIIKASRTVPELSVCVAYSGDSGYYSGTRSLLPLLDDAGIDAEVLPGISSIQVMAARLRMAWQDWKLVSAHGTDCDAVTEVMSGQTVFFLTGGTLGPAELCQQLTDAGLGGLHTWVGERLSYEDEKISEGTAEEFAGREFHPLSVMLVEPAACAGDMTPGIDDGEFIRGDIPMTKQTVRAAVISKMCVRKSDVVWDIGAGTGSVSIELAMKASKGRVWAVEREPEGCRLLRENKNKFGVWNLNIVQGSAPKALADLPAPDRVFIGGSDGTLDEIIETALAKNDDALICVSAIVLETLSEAVRAMTSRGLDVDIIQISVNKAKAIGERHMMMAANPIYIITGRKPPAEEAADA